MNKKIVFVSGSRSDYRYLYSILVNLKKINYESFEFIVTGSHLDSRFGKTVNEIKLDGIDINREISLFDFESNIKIPYQISSGIKNISNYFEETKPSLIVIAGDRYEILAVAISAFFLDLEIVHIGGGETTFGSKDNSIRHCISKLAKYHFPSNKDAEKLLINFGIDKKNIFCLGSTGLEDFYSCEPMQKNVLFKKFNLNPMEKLALVTVHPESLREENLELIKNISTALHNFDIQIIFTAANADNGGDKINAYIKDLINSKNKYFYMPNLGRLDYISVMNSSDLMIGNSSSGLTEAPSLGLPVVNIGKRQEGRLRGSNVIDAENNVRSIENAIKKGLDKNFKDSLRDKGNPYYQGPVSEQIAKKLLNLRKKVYD